MQNQVRKVSLVKWKECWIDIWMISNLACNLGALSSLLKSNFLCFFLCIFYFFFLVRQYYSFQIKPNVNLSNNKKIYTSRLWSSVCHSDRTWNLICVVSPPPAYSRPVSEPLTLSGNSAQALCSTHYSCKIPRLHEPSHFEL